MSTGSPCDSVVSEAYQSCVALVREVDRRASACANQEFLGNVKLAKGVLERGKRPCERTATASAGSSSLQKASIVAGGASPESSFLLSGPLWAVVFSGFYWKKRRVSELALTALQLMLQCHKVNCNVYAILFSNPTRTVSGRRSAPAMTFCMVGEGAYVVLTEYLSTTTEPAIQTRILQILEPLISGVGRHYFTGKCVTRVVHAVFSVALQTAQGTLRSRSQDLLQRCVLRVTRGFVLASRTYPAHPCTFATNTPLEDYTTDVEPDAPFTALHIVSSQETTAQFSPPPHAPEASERISGSFNPNTMFSHSLDETTIQSAVQVLQAEERLPAQLTDMLLLIRNTCRMATRPCSGSPTEGNPDIRARQLALKMLERVFEELPVSNCEMEHRCATWMRLVFAACTSDLLRCLVQNLSVIHPFSCFESATRTLSLLLRKCYYHLHRELHSLLSVFLLPLAGSKYCDFRQKHAVLRMLLDLLSVPHLMVSFYINYDCNPTFDTGGTYGGMVELMVDFLTELMYLDHVAEDSEDWLSSDQQQLLRSECIVAVHAFVAGLYKWVSTDPKEYAAEVRRVKRTSLLSAAGGAHIDESYLEELAEVYLSNWDRMDEEESVLTADITTSRPVPNTISLPLPGGAPVTPAAAAWPWGRCRAVCYHWKHIHSLLHNKRIALTAVSLINDHKWLEAKEHLERLHYLPTHEMSVAEANWEPVTPGTSSYAHLARFLFDYPGISREAITGIFDCINKPHHPSKYILVDYFHLFDYKDVPLDIALRDSTCKFMSWERPMFEAQVWGTIQATFGAAYAAQNSHAITAKDADTMAGVLLFLHATLHNNSARGSCMEIETFVASGNACLDIPLEESYMHSMYRRMQRCKWQLDALGRTPREVELANDVSPLSIRIVQEWQSTVQDANTVPTPTARTLVKSKSLPGIVHMEEEGNASLLLASTVSIVRDSDSTGEKDLSSVQQGKDLGSTVLWDPGQCDGSEISTAVSAVPSLVPLVHLTASQTDVALLDASPPVYCDTNNNLKLREDHHIAFKEMATTRLASLEAVHRRVYANRNAYHPQPYVVPHYAEHVRPLLLSTYPQIMACLYLGLRILEESPLFHQIQNTFQLLYDLAAAFVVNLGDLRPAVVDSIQRYLTDEAAHRLLAMCRATFVPFLLHNI